MNSTTTIPDLFRSSSSSFPSTTSPVERSQQFDPSPVLHCFTLTKTSNENYTRKKIRYLLKLDKAQYIVIDNANSKLLSDCWRLFGSLVNLDSSGVHQRIYDYVSCRKYFATYSCITNSTTFLKNMPVVLLVLSIESTNPLLFLHHHPNQHLQNL